MNAIFFMRRFVTGFPFGRLLPMAVLGSWLFSLSLGAKAALSPTVSTAWTYTLVDGSTLFNDCMVCARPSFFVPLRGQFTLRLLAQGPLFTTFALENIQFSGGD